MGLFKVLGYTTRNNVWETLTDSELAKHDILIQLQTHKGECDWDPNFGTTIMDKMFQPKTVELKKDIMEEIESTIDSDPRFSLNDIQAEEVEKGWIFLCSVSYLDGVPEEWTISITEDGIKEYLSGESYPLGD